MVTKRGCHRSLIEHENGTTTPADEAPAEAYLARLLVELEVFS
jgi:hypothetical protein